MFLGITENLHDKKQHFLSRKIRLVTGLFGTLILLPFVLYFLFHLNILHSRSPFSQDIQEPVAKVTAPGGTGSAFLISPTLLLTARHVIGDLKVGDLVDLSFEKSGSKLQAKGKIKYIGATTVQPSNNGASLDYFLTDVAVLEVPAINDIEPLVLGESDGIKNLDDVILIGYPSGDYSITQGKINSDQYQSLNLFKTDAAANPGNSGGPLLLKEDNTVIAILVGGSSGPAQGENIALKINDVKALLKAAKINF